MSTHWSESVPFNFEKLRVAEAAATWAMDGWFVVQGADRRCDGGQVNAPPCTRSDGKSYRWLMPLLPVVGVAPEAPIRISAIEGFLDRRSTVA